MLKRPFLVPYLFVVVALLLATQCFSYQSPSIGRPSSSSSSSANHNVNRRDVFRSAFFVVATSTSLLPVENAAAAVISSKYCASGVGEGCQDLSDGNELIKSLQEKSAANKEKNEQVRLNVLCVRV